MLYQRPKPAMDPSPRTAADGDADDRKPSQFFPKPLVLFTFDISHWSSTLQSLILIGGLILFMCLYGYYQELVIYGWFDRKLAIFSTFLHFAGCSVFALLQRHVSRPTVTPTCSPCSSWSAWSMGSAPPRTAFAYYLLLVCTKTAAQGMSNLSMTQINYPAKVLFKSANPICTLVLGVCYLRRAYPARDYAVVLLLVLGLYVFITGDLADAPQATSTGVFYVVLSMFGSAGVPMIQEHVITTYHATVEDLLYYSYLGSTLISLLLSVANGEFMVGCQFLLASGSVHTWFIFMAFCSFGFLGANFSTAITAQYGALVNGIANTFRKAVTILLSFFLFPERNTLSTHKVLGGGIFFLGLAIRVFMTADSREESSKEGSSSSSSSRKMVSDEPALYLNANMQMLALSESTEDLLDMEKQCPHTVHTENRHEHASAGHDHGAIAGISTAV